MQNDKLDYLKNKVQEIIDLIGDKKNQEANIKLAEASELLDELLDLSGEDEDLIILSQFQVLLNQLYIKAITPSNN